MFGQKLTKTQREYQSAMHDAEVSVTDRPGTMPEVKLHLPSLCATITFRDGFFDGHSLWVPEDVYQSATLANVLHEMFWRGSKMRYWMNGASRDWFATQAGLLEENMRELEQSQLDTPDVDDLFTDAPNVSSNVPALDAPVHIWQWAKQKGRDEIPTATRQAEIARDNMNRGRTA